jgi:hypothetical protein
MDAMSPKHSSKRLGWVGYCWLGVAVLLVAAGMGIAFWYSFSNLSAAAAAHGWHPPFLLPLVIDTGVPAYVIIDQMIVALGRRSVLPRAAAWGFATLTVFLNGAVSADPSALWRITHAAMPAAWIIGIESLRLLWRVLRQGPAGQRKRIPLSRWLLARQSTWDLWKRMKLWGMDDYGEALEMEIARQRAIEALGVTYGSAAWRTAAPADLVWMLDNGVHMDEALATVAALTAEPQGEVHTVATPAASARRPRVTTPRKSTPRTAREVRVPADVETQAEALKILDAEPAISGRELGRRLGVDPSYGCRLKKRLTAPAPATGEQPAITDHAEGEPIDR